MVEEMEVGTLKVHGKQVMYTGDDKTEVKSLVLPRTKKVATLLAKYARRLNSVLFGRSRRDTKQRVSLSLQESEARTGARSLPNTGTS